MPARDFDGSGMPENPDVTPQDLFYASFSIMVDKARQLVSEKVNGYLSIGGQPLSQIITNGQYPEEDIDALIHHMVEKRPKLADTFKSYNDAIHDVIFTGQLPTGTDLSDFGKKITQALAADQKEASRDKCKWATMVWKWQKSDKGEP